MADPRLPPVYRVLPESIEYRIPGFSGQYSRGDQVLALRDRDSEEWFLEFADRVASSIGVEFLPICRMSDGEFLFWLGTQPPSIRLPVADRMVSMVRHFLRGTRQRGRFLAQTTAGVSSGSYTYNEWRDHQDAYGRLIKQISEKGILALHFEYGPRPFQEHFFPALSHRFQRLGIRLTDRNYYPFYFVYALMLGPFRARLLAGRSVLLVNGAQGEKRKIIERHLKGEGVRKIQWLSISPDRSLFSTVDLSEIDHPVDLAIVGAGVGKPHVLLQLEQLGTPCIDAGYVFEVWANPILAFARPFCRPDGHQ